MSNSRININITFPDSLDIDDRNQVREYLKHVSADITRQVYTHIKQRREADALKEQEKFINNFFNNPRYIEKLIHDKQRR